MGPSPQDLRTKVNHSLGQGHPDEAICYLTELVASHPDDRHTRTALAIALGDAGNPAGALKVLRALADRLAHDGYLLPAMVVCRHGLARAPNDAGLIDTLTRLHVRGQRAKAGALPIPPALKNQRPTPAEAAADALLALDTQTRLTRATDVGMDLGPSGEATIPIPMPLFSELDQDAFIETVRHLSYQRLPQNSVLLTEGEPGSTLLILASGHVNIAKGGQHLARIGPGSVLGEMALITGAPRSAAATAAEEVEIFTLSREDVQRLAKNKPQVAEELIEYCRKRMIANLMATSPLFKRFDPDTRYQLITKFQRMGFQAGQSIITQGEPGKGLFVLATGEVQITVVQDGKDPVVVAHLGPGEVVGEISLIHDQPTSASVIAVGRVGALFLPRDAFQEVVRAHPEVHEYLKTLSADRIKASKSATDDATEILDADDLIIL